MGHTLTGLLQYGQSQQSQGCGWSLHFCPIELLRPLFPSARDVSSLEELMRRLQRHFILDALQAYDEDLETTECSLSLNNLERDSSLSTAIAYPPLMPPRHPSTRAAEPSSMPHPAQKISLFGWRQVDWHMGRRTTERGFFYAGTVLGSLLSASHLLCWVMQ